MADLIRYEVKDRVAVITIDNPPVNALSPAVWEGIDEAVQRAVADPAADAIVLIGAGTTFIAGADIKVFDTLKTKADSFTRSAGTHALLRRMEDAAKPLVAAIHGNALGGGLEVAQACHFRVATKDARVGQPEVLLGIIPGAGGTQRLPRLAGVKTALEMCADGKPVAAPKARTAGSSIGSSTPTCSPARSRLPRRRPARTRFASLARWRTPTPALRRKRSL